MMKFRCSHHNFYKLKPLKSLSKILILVFKKLIHRAYNTNLFKRNNSLQHPTIIKFQPKTIGHRRKKHIVKINKKYNSYKQKDLTFNQLSKSKRNKRLKFQQF